MAHDRRGRGSKEILLSRRQERPDFIIKDEESADVDTAARCQRRASIEAEMGGPSDDRKMLESFILR